MSITLTPLVELPQTEVDDARTLLRAIVSEKYPGIDLDATLFESLLLDVLGTVYAAVSTYVQDVDNSTSLQKIQEDPESADADLVDLRAANFRVTRQTATRAGGEVVIVISRQLATTIPAGSQFTANGTTFQTEESFAARLAESNLLYDTDRLLESAGTNRYKFTVTVTATDTGAAGQLKQGAKLIPTTPPAYFVEAYAASDFTGGRDGQSNTELQAELTSGLSVKSIASRLSVLPTIKTANVDEYPEAAEFADIVAGSVIGFGDEELSVDTTSLFPIRKATRAELYVKTSQQIQLVEYTVAATLVGTYDGFGVWQFVLDKSEAAGVYEIKRVVKTTADADSTGYEVTSDFRGVDLTGEGYIPAITQNLEGAYSAYQTITVKIVDTDTDINSLTIGTSSQEYLVTVAYQPQLANIQTFLSRSDVRNPNGDVLAKAAVPAYVRIAMKIVDDSEVEFDEDPIRLAIQAYIGQLGFAGRLYVSQLTSEIVQALPASAVLSNIYASLRVRAPSGTNLYVRNEHLLEVPYEPDELVSDKTVAFFVNDEDIIIEVQ